MTNDKICEAEYNRTKNQLNKIYLFNNNSGFWRANEWSCYLLYNCNPKLNVDQRLKLSHKTAKAGMDKSIISCGLKESSFSKFMVDYTESQIKEENIENIKIFEINLSSINSNVTVDNYLDILKDFKNSIEISKLDKNNILENRNPFNNPVSFTSIVKKIIRYSLYNKSEQELVSFIEELKEDSCSLF